MLERNPRAARLVRNYRHDDRRRYFRLRQTQLAWTAVLFVGFYAVSGHPLFAPLAVLILTTGAIEAHRFRISGRSYLTRGRPIAASICTERLRRQAQT